MDQVLRVSRHLQHRFVGISPWRKSRYYLGSLGKSTVPQSHNHDRTVKGVRRGLSPSAVAAAIEQSKPKVSVLRRPTKRSRHPFSLFIQTARVHRNRGNPDRSSPLTIAVIPSGSLRRGCRELAAADRNKGFENIVTSLVGPWRRHIHNFVQSRYRGDWA